ncbi:uncharacterized protein N7511_010700 [Penicillium nucicola]|uniref:uncharacterized protein n=1 Tax=Penicillium nucicola TaxID=1850975 RepID=UPI0025454BAC|nr:uncharacterized protein N7511_010700 [Penicillium nucicola]KAJ5749004.1 hypothetical protein N7511_010700 [Penicillium nucicola]
MADLLRLVDGKVLTNTDVQPPAQWTNDYDEMGGDEQWGPEGNVLRMITVFGIEGEVKPLFAMDPEAGEALSLFQVGDGPFYFFNIEDLSIFKITSHSDLKEIAQIIDSKGLAGLRVEAL